jgi:hypothetical protein
MKIYIDYNQEFVCQICDEKLGKYVAVCCWENSYHMCKDCLPHGLDALERNGVC